MAGNRNFAVAAGLCVGLGIGAWGFYLRAITYMRGEGWMVYATALQAWRQGELHLLYDGTALTALLNARFAAALAHPLPLHPWLYPPHYLLLLLPFAWLPPLASGVVFVGAGFAALLAAACLFWRAWRQRLIGALLLALSPASAVTVLLGQNTFFTAALLVGGFGLVRRRPWLGGALLGVATYKPQLCLLAPVALVAERQWKALAAAAGAALALAAASAALFGLDLWRDWLRLMLEPSPLFAQWTALARLNGQSVYTYAALLGAAPALANAIQAAAALAAAAAVWLAHRRDLAPEQKLAVLLAATMLAAPHIIDYDALLLGLAATLLLLRGLDGELPAGAALLLVLIWVSPFFNPPSVWPVAYATVPLILGFILWVMRRPGAPYAAWVWL